MIQDIRRIMIKNIIESLNMYLFRNKINRLNMQIFRNGENIVFDFSSSIWYPNWNHDQFELRITRPNLRVTMPIELSSYSGLKFETSIALVTPRAPRRCRLSWIRPWKGHRPSDDLAAWAMSPWRD